MLVPADWRIEMDPKTTRSKGNVAFHTPLKNLFYVSWGPLEEATRRFKSLEEQRDHSISQVTKGPDVKSHTVTDQKEERVGGHRVLFSHVESELKGGLLGKSAGRRHIWSAHFYCEESKRFYVIYTLVKDRTEFEDHGAVFSSLVKSFACAKSQSKSGTISL